MTGRSHAVPELRTPLALATGINQTGHKHIAIFDSATRQPHCDRQKPCVTDTPSPRAGAYTVHSGTVPE